MRKLIIFISFLTFGILVERAATGGGLLDGHRGPVTGLILAGSFFTIAFAAVVHK